jgi:thymidylate synthase ThyX
MAEALELHHDHDLFESEGPKVILTNAFDDSFNNAVATARTCYSSRVIHSEDVDKTDKSREQRDRIAESIYAAGHHTTIQHATFQFVLENVSRQFLWSFLHAHPFYNSEQVSQRYVSVKPDRVLIPKLSGQAAQRYKQTVQEQMSCYQRLVELLVQPASKAYFSIFQARQKHEERYAGALKKKAQEVARYALPVGTFAHLYHTVSGLTLHRYNRLCRIVDVPKETELVIALMIEAVNQHDPLFFRSIEDPMAIEETHEFKTLQNYNRLKVSSEQKRFIDHFDAELDGRISRMVGFKPAGEALVARSVRSMLGMLPEELSDAEAIALVLDPAKNNYLPGALNLTSLGKLSRAMHHPHFTFQKKLSHSADSQDQRHRMVPGSRPILHCHYSGGEPDVVVPALLRQSQEAYDCFMETMHNTWQAIDELLDMDVSPEDALYLLPNAFPIRFEESGDLSAFHHKWTTRLCYNAQEEIWGASLEEVRQVREVHPVLGQYLEPPCGVRLRAGEKPYCPEGDRYCGVPVWRLPMEEYERVI